ncbi:hypothetical protein BDV96DRAFT_214780 [Lophiotrema nucula]|uniref:Uncharacterized protein n=1 Tax=Lophiotrema nucula TaxID=690887 RepID=A0A6A5ZPA8_9PLEO|nr:hypothetical protein BDV96DRAFT_214780 [Lophiotrema nucula]
MDSIADTNPDQPQVAAAIAGKPDALPSPPESEVSEDRDLNPEAAPFELSKTERPSPLRARAKTFVPSDVEDVANHSSVTIVGGLAWDKKAGVLRLTFDTINASDYRPLQLHEAIANLAAIGHLPTAVQLNVLAGPRLPRVHYINNLITNALGPYITVVKTLQLTIMRHGDYIGGRISIPEMELEKFAPLRQFVGELIRTFPPTVKFVWGCSPQYEARLKEYFHHKAVPAALEALQEHQDKGVAAYSSAIDGKVLTTIARWFFKNGLQGRKCDLEGHANYIARFNTPGLQNVPHIVYPSRFASGPSSPTGSSGSTLDPKAYTFVPSGGPLPNDVDCPRRVNGIRAAEPLSASERSKRVPLFVPGQTQESGVGMYGKFSMPFDPNDPFAPQMKAVDKQAHKVYDRYDQPPPYYAPEHHVHGFDAGTRLNAVAQQYIPTPANNYYSPPQYPGYSYNPAAAPNYGFVQPDARYYYEQPSYSQPPSMATAPRLYNPAAAAALASAPVAVRNPGLYAPSMSNIYYGNGYGNFSGYYPSSNGNGYTSAPKKSKSKAKKLRAQAQARAETHHYSKDTARILGTEMPHFDPKTGFGVVPRDSDVDVDGVKVAGPGGVVCGNDGNVAARAASAYLPEDFPPLGGGMENGSGGEEGMRQNVAW